MCMPLTSNTSDPLQVAICSTCKTGVPKWLIYRWCLSGSKSFMMFAPITRLTEAEVKLAVCIKTHQVIIDDWQLSI